MTDDPVPTLGQRLDAQGRLMAARLLPSLPWAAPLHILLARTTALASAFAGRFERTEFSPDSDRSVRPLPRTAAAPSQHPAPPAPGPAGRHGTPSAGPGNRTPTGFWDSTPANGRPLPADVRGRLREVAGRGADTVHVHDDEAADAVARSHRADAVTVGRDVYFRQGRFRPGGARGFALLVHEATHVLALLRPGADWRRATGAGAAAEEAEALARERAALAHRTPPHDGRTGPRSAPAELLAPPARHGRPTPSPALPGPGGAEARPMCAADDRDTGAASTGEKLDVEALRRGLLDELMRRIRSDSERGG